MKHLKTFENFNSSTNEEFFPNIFGKKLSEAEKKAEAEAKAKAETEVKRLEQSGLLKFDPIDKAIDVLKKIYGHPTKKKQYDSMIKNGEEEKAEKYIQFFIKKPDVKYWKWDENEKKWVSAGIETPRTHTFGSGA